MKKDLEKKTFLIVFVLEKKLVLVRKYRC